MGVVQRGALYYSHCRSRLPVHPKQYYSIKFKVSTLSLLLKVLAPVLVQNNYQIVMSKFVCPQNPDL